MRTDNSFRNTLHFYNRAGFGTTFKDGEKQGRHSLERTVDKYIESSSATKPLNVVTFVQPANYKMLSDDEKKAFNKLRGDQNLLLNTSFIQRFLDPKTALRERMTLFWHGHFACRDNNPVYSQQLNNLERQYALENFRELLIAVSQSPAMLQFLNNQQNVKAHPNENFARELMELFTIGRGNYTESDIKESARAFTGWKHDETGAFKFNAKVHDPGTKTFMGRTGTFQGEDIIDILLSRKETATFLAGKIYAYLVSDVPLPRRISDLGDYYFASGYNTGALVKHILTSDWFYADDVIGKKIKSPAELLGILNKCFAVNYKDPKTLIYLQQLLGQTLFNPPNVSGWKGGRNWINTSSLLFRMKVPSMMLNSGIIEFQGKPDPEEEALIAFNKKNGATVQKKMNTSVDWNAFLTALPDPVSQGQLIEYFLPSGLDTNKRHKILSTNTGDLQRIVIQLISTPEYQLF